MSDQNPSRPNNLPMKIGAGVLVVVIFLAVVIYSRKSSDTNEVANNNTTTPAANTVANTNTESTAPTTQTGAYKAGTYNSTGTYMTPGGKEEVAVSLTIDASGKVTNSTVTAEAKAPTSKQFQAEFINNYK